VNCVAWKMWFLAIQVHCARSVLSSICTGTTGHAEVVQITFDPDIISFKELFGIFLTIHDPTNSIDRGQRCGHSISFSDLLSHKRTRKDCQRRDT
jgi:peptide methionine sulfoxide reductase MsrA